MHLLMFFCLCIITTWGDNLSQGMEDAVSQRGWNSMDVEKNWGVSWECSLGERQWERLEFHP